MFGRLKRDSNNFVQTKLKAAAIQADSLQAVTIDDVDILLTRLDGKIVAFSGTCPHAAADLSDGSLHRGRITCPLHDWKFDIQSGRTLWPEDEACRLSHFAVKLVNEVVWVQGKKPA